MRATAIKYLLQAEHAAFALVKTVLAVAFIKLALFAVLRPSAEAQSPHVIAAIQAVG